MNYVLLVLGAVSLGVGVVGIFLPLIPTTPLLLLTAFLWARASPRLYTWLLKNRYLGVYIRNFREHRAIPLRAKVCSVGLLWATILYCIFSAVRHLPWVGLCLFFLAVILTWHILSYATLRK